MLHNFNGPTRAEWISRCTDEILSKNPEEVLPSRLSEEWLAVLQHDIVQCLDRQSASDGKPGMISLSFIAHMMYGKTGEGRTSIYSYDEIIMLFHSLKAEVDLELLRRHSAVAPEGATLETIFDDQRVGFMDLLASRSLH